jgi:type II protein arginine methyltransferase
MFASAAGANAVYACEMSRTMHETARNVLAANSISDVTLIHKKSTHLAIGLDIPER